MKWLIIVSLHLYLCCFQIQLFSSLNKIINTAETVFLVNFEDLQVCSIKVFLVVISLEVETVFVSIID